MTRSPLEATTQLPPQNLTRHAAAKCVKLSGQAGFGSQSSAKRILKRMLTLIFLAVAVMVLGFGMWPSPVGIVAGLLALIALILTVTKVTGGF